MATRTEAEMTDPFGDRYRLCCTPPMMAAELDALGTDYGSAGYTTRAQADDLAERPRLAEGDRVADIGAGSGWPGLYGFVDLVEVDRTEEYAQTQQDWYDAAERRADELRCSTSETEFADAQADRRLTLDAIAAGLLRRSLFIATRP